ncbi:hypothetical protein GCM10023346_38130 [Arthrobacter gyeryongensis]|uniref:Uncharacterized protein n=1 Tax=Arthrobacter gyeryongensis TaxID=1650592 RepID=A0ABP9SQA4_9MICC
MNPLITLAAPQDSSPLTFPVRPMGATVLPEPMRVYPEAYAEAPRACTAEAAEGAADIFDDVLGIAVAEVSLVAAAPDGRFTDPAHRRQGLDEQPLHPEGPGAVALGHTLNTTGTGRADHDPAQAHSGSHGLKRGSYGDRTRPSR